MADPNRENEVEDRDQDDNEVIGQGADDEFEDREDLDSEDQGEETDLNEE